MVFEAVAEGVGKARRLLTAYHEAAHQVAQDPTARRLAELDRLGHELEAQDAWRLNARVEEVTPAWTCRQTGWSRPSLAG